VRKTKGSLRSRRGRGSELKKKNFFIINNNSMVVVVMVVVVGWN
jgi:hypothetical protein